MQDHFQLKLKDYLLITVMIIVVCLGIFLKYFYNTDLTIEILLGLIIVFTFSFIVISRNNNTEVRNNLETIKAVLSNLTNESNKNHIKTKELVSNYFGIIKEQEKTISENILNNREILSESIDRTKNVQEQISLGLSNINNNSEKLKSIEKLLNSNFANMAKVENIQLIINQIENVNTTNITNLNIIKELNNTNIALIQEAKKVGESQHLALSERITELNSENALVIKNQFNDISSKVETLLEGEQLTSSIEKVNAEIIASENRNRSKLEDALRLLAELNRLQIEQSQNISNRINQLNEENKTSFELETNIQKDIQGFEVKLQREISELSKQVEIETKNVQSELTQTLLDNLSQHLINIQEDIVNAQEQTVGGIGAEIQSSKQLFNDSLKNALIQITTQLTNDTNMVKSELTQTLLDNLSQHLINMRKDIQNAKGEAIGDISDKLSDTNSIIQNYSQTVDNSILELQKHFSKLNNLIIEDLKTKTDNIIKNIVETNESILSNNKVLENKVLEFLGTTLVETLSNSIIDLNKNSEFLYNNIIKEIGDKKIGITSIMNSLYENEIEKFDSINANISKIGLFNEDFIKNKVDLLVANNNKLVKEQLENISDRTHSFIQNEVSSIVKTENEIITNKITSHDSQLSSTTIKKVNQNNKKELSDLYNQIDALLSINSFIKIRHPLPIMRGWPASPDFILRLINIIFETKPKTILDVGSGVTSLIAGYCIEKIGSGKVVSIDHNEKYYNITKSNIQKHGLEKVIDLNLAPLKEYNINGKEWLWYNNEFLKSYNSFDLIIVDGPPGSTQKKARYPVIPLLKNQISANCNIILDDGKREEEKELAEMWVKENSNFRSSFFKDDEKGTFVIINK